LEKHGHYVRVCRRLAHVGLCVGISRRRNRVRSRRREAMRERLANDLRLATIDLRPQEIEIAGNSLMMLTCAALMTVCAPVLLLTGTSHILPLIVAAATVPLVSKELLISYPSRVAARRTEQVLKRSAEATNLMIMSLRHEPSIPKAIAFASARDDDFSRELRTCTWKVIMGKFESFEEALLSLGDRWAGLGDDLKTSLNSMVTSSREATHDGRRRALDRANQAMIAGGKRRIEEYAMSLSTPSMLIFGLGILLPLMVGSFLPMLSWNIWSMDGISRDGGLHAQSQSTSQMVFIMNLLFPTIAYFIAMSAVSSHPLESDSNGAGKMRLGLSGGLAALVVSGALCTAVWISLDESVPRSVFLLFSAVGPFSIWLLANGRLAERIQGHPAEDLEDVLFRTGARMLEGENFEASLHRAAADLGRGRSEAARKLSLRGVLAANELGDEPFLEESSFGVRNATQGLRITREAAAKDEAMAGLLAMDLASYLKDLRDLENTLKNRLKPTISMMKTTALFLAPIVLGVTYAIYLSLASMLGGRGDATGAGLFFLVLGIFLAQMDAVVVYFVWGIEGKRGIDRLAAAVGGYVVVSEVAYSATALLASA
jgi:hypothetical protein